MKKYLLIFTISFGVLPIFSQIKAVTEEGESVILYDDGKWEYEDSKSGTMEAEKEISTNPSVFGKGPKSTFLLKSKKSKFGFWLDPKKWNVQSDKNNPYSEFELKLKEGDLYGMMIVEGFEIPLETLRQMAFEKGQSAAPDLKIVKEEYRMVNGLKVLHMQMNGTIQGIKFTYYGYYYSNESGTVQFVTYTAQNLLEKYKPDCEQLLNGLIVQ